MIDGDKFFHHVRAYFGNLDQPQVDGFNLILAEWVRRADAGVVHDIRWLAYMLATAWWETGRTMQPVTEYGSEAYLRSRPYWPWIGRGLPQVTWKANYDKFGEIVDGKRVWTYPPEDMLKWPLALRTLFDGMIEGLYTGQSLHTYFNDRVNNPEEARRIINGLDRASLVAGFYGQFLAALT